MTKEATDKAWLSAAELAELPVEAVRWYSRFNNAAVAVVAAIDAICDDLALEPIKRPTAESVYRACLVLGQYWDYGAGLFHTLCLTAGIGESEERAYLTQSIDDVTEKVAALFGGGKDIEDAIRAYKQWEGSQKSAGDGNGETVAPRSEWKREAG